MVELPKEKQSQLLKEGRAFMYDFYAVKKLILLFILFVVSIESKAYKPFIEENKFFDVGTYQPGHVCGWGDKLPKRYYFKGDTIIEGKKYAKVYYYNMLGQQPYCPPFNVDTVSFLADFFIREDSLKQQLYKLLSFQTNEEIVFDFTKLVGDTLYQDITASKIDSITTITTTDGEKRRKFWLSSSNYYIEGIGGNRGPFIKAFPDFEGKEFTMCIKKSGLEIFDGGYCYDFITSVKALEKSAIVLSPNPVQEILFFNSLLPVEYQVYSVIGKIVLSGFDSKINVSTLTSGRYFIKFNTPENSSYSSFIKD